MLKTSCSGNICIFPYDSPIKEGRPRGGREPDDAGGESSHCFSELVYGASGRPAESEGVHFMDEETDSQRGEIMPGIR